MQGRLKGAGSIALESVVTNMCEHREGCENAPQLLDSWSSSTKTPRLECLCLSPNSQACFQSQVSTVWPFKGFVPIEVVCLEHIYIKEKSVNEK